MSVLNATTGALARTVQVGSMSQAQSGLNSQAIAIDESIGRVFVADLGGHTIHVLDATTGTIVRVIAVGIHPSALAIDERTQHLFAITGDGTAVSMVDAHTGRLLKTSAVGASASVLAIDERSGRVFVATRQCVDCSGWISLLDARTGNVRSTVTLFHQEDQSISVCAVAVDVGTNRALAFSAIERDSSRVHILDGMTGTVRQSVTLGPALCTAQDMAIDERTGHAFVLNAYGAESAGPGTVSMLDLRTGRVLHTVTVVKPPPGPNPQFIQAALATDERAGRLYVASETLSGGTLGPGIVSVLDTHTGQILRTITVVASSPRPTPGYLVGAIAINPQTGQLYVLNPGQGAVIIVDPKT